MTVPAVDNPSLFHQNLRRSYRTITHGKGIRLWDDAGREYIDGDSGAISVVSIGHGVDEVVDAMAAQARQLAYVHCQRRAYGSVGGARQRVALKKI